VRREALAYMNRPMTRPTMPAIMRIRPIVARSMPEIESVTA
jgi:hypothetical protein